MTIDKMRHIMGEQIFTYISGLNKEQAENMLKRVVHEMPIAQYFQEGNRITKLNAEKAYLEYRLEIINNPARIDPLVGILRFDGGFSSNVIVFNNAELQAYVGKPYLHCGVVISASFNYTKAERSEREAYEKEWHE